MDVVELTNNVAMVELDVRTEWVGKTLRGLDLRKKYSLNVVAVRQGESVCVSVDPEKPLTEDMKLIVIANKTQLGKLK